MLSYNFVFAHFNLELRTCSCAQGSVRHLLRRRFVLNFIGESTCDSFYCSISETAIIFGADVAIRSLDCLEMSRVQIDLGAVGHMQILVH